MSKKLLKNNKGFALLFSVLLSIIVLAVGAAIISVSLKQIILSGTSRDSKKAFYAANSGVECALYWDLKDNGIFGTSTVDLKDGGETCLSNDITNGTPGQNPADDEFGLGHWTFNNAGQTTFWIYYDETLKSEPCAEVTVKKEFDVVNGLSTTTIQSMGYNMCDFDNSRIVERGLEVIY